MTRRTIRRAALAGAALLGLHAVPAQAGTAEAALRPVAITKVTVVGRTITTTVDVRAAGRVRILLTRRGRTVPLGSVVLARPLTVTTTGRAPRRLAPGRYVLRARLTRPGRAAAEARRIIRLR